METINTQIQKLQSGDFDKILSWLHPNTKDLSQEQQRFCHILQEFQQIFGDEASVRLFSAPGRTEIGGNHTDHQRGCVVGASIDLDIITAASPRNDNIVRFQSEGFPIFEVDLNDLTIHPEEVNQSTSLIRGIAAGLKEKGFQFGGFNAYASSNVLGGSGLSSSAAFEIMVGTLQNYLYNNGSIDPVTIAQVGQYAENKYFGKPCGLLDQAACSVGGYVAIDFYNPEKPIVEKIDFDFASCGYTMCIVDVGGSHADLTHEYAAVTSDMKTVAQYFGKEVLREVPAKDFYASMGSLREKVSDRAILRAYHFFEENIRAQEIAQALREKDFDRFKKLSTSSGQSSFMYLQNVYASSAPEEQCVSIALAASEHILKGKGAYRVHGGGFGGTIQVFVPNDMLEYYQTEIEKVTGQGTCHLLAIRPVGGVEITENK